MASDSIGIYVHVPFCKRKCGYCSFYSGASDADTRKKYADALCKNIRSYRDRALSCDTVFFGGGTPTVLETELICRVLETVGESFTLAMGAEITLEANPDSADFDKLSALRSAGFNRVSFGVQSLDDDELSALGRLHSAEQAVTAVENAARAGFENISCDIMIGIPKQDTESLMRTADRLAALPITHLSAYMLSVEDGTPFSDRGVKTDPDVQAEMYLALIERLKAHGFIQYEISNFARDGHTCRHNLKYWHAEKYLGFGCHAHSFFGDERYSCEADIREYIASDIQPKTVLETAPDKLEEYIMLGLRLTAGISYERLAALGADRDRLDRIKKLVRDYEKHGLCTADERGFSLTPGGFLVSNDIIGAVELC